MLGGHVTGRAHDLAALRLIAVRAQPLGQAEIGDLGDALDAEEDVGRLEIAVNDPNPVSGLDGLGERRDELGGRSACLGRAVQAIFERAPLEQLQRHEGPVTDFPDLKNHRDIGVPKLGHCLGLDLEAGEAVRPKVSLRADHFQSHQAIESHLTGLVDNSHPPFAQLLQDLVSWDGRKARAWALSATR